jgi:hypothetical protein
MCSAIVGTRGPCGLGSASDSIHRNGCRGRTVAVTVKRFGTLSFGHYGPLGGGRQLTARDSMLQAIDLAQGMVDLGVNGAYFRVHHFARQQ